MKEWHPDKCEQKDAKKEKCQKMPIKFNDMHKKTQKIPENKSKDEYLYVNGISPEDLKEQVGFSKHDFQRADYSSMLSYTKTSIQLLKQIKDGLSYNDKSSPGKFTDEEFHNAISKLQFNAISKLLKDNPDARIRWDYNTRSYGNKDNWQILKAFLQSLINKLIANDNPTSPFSWDVKDTIEGKKFDLVYTHKTPSAFSTAKGATTIFTTLNYGWPNYDRYPRHAWI